MNWQSWLALSVVILLVALVLGFRFKKDHRSGGRCDGNCGSCH